MKHGVPLVYLTFIPLSSSTAAQGPGPPTAMTRSRLASSTCADTAYINTRLARMVLVGVPTDALKKQCGIVILGQEHDVLVRQSFAYSCVRRSPPVQRDDVFDVQALGLQDSSQAQREVLVEQNLHDAWRTAGG